MWNLLLLTGLGVAAYLYYRLYTKCLVRKVGNCVVFTSSDGYSYPVKTDTDWFKVGPYLLPSGAVLPVVSAADLHLTSISVTDLTMLTTNTFTGSTPVTTLYSTGVDLTGDD